MNSVVSLVLNFLTKEHVISSEKDTQEFYRYGIEISISSILNVVLIVLLGLITQHIVESIVFLTVFIFLRSFMGGYHANTYFRCNLLMCTSFLAVTFLFERIKNDVSLVFAIIITLLSVIIVSIFCPVENINKPISDERKPKLKIASIMMCLLFSSIGIILLVNNIDLGVMVLLTILLIVVLIIAAKIKGGVINEKLQEKNCQND